MRLTATAFGIARNKHGRPIGHTVTHIERMLPYLAAVLTDSRVAIEELARWFCQAPRSEKVLTQAEWQVAKLLAFRPETVLREPLDIAQSLVETQPTKAEWRVARWLAPKLSPGINVHKFHCLPQYVSAPIPRKPIRMRPGRPQVLWASRVTRQKFPELLPRIAR